MPSSCHSRLPIFARHLSICHIVPILFDFLPILHVVLSLFFLYFSVSLFCLFQSPDIFDLMSTRNTMYWIQVQRSKHFIMAQKKLRMWQVKRQKQLQKARGIPAPRGNHPACVLCFTFQLHTNQSPATQPPPRETKAMQIHRQDAECLGADRGGRAVLQWKPLESSPRFLFSSDKIQSSLCIQDKRAPIRCSFHIASLHYCDHLLSQLCQAPMDYEDHHTLTREPGTEIEARFMREKGDERIWSLQYPTALELQKDKQYRSLFGKRAKNISRVALYKQSGTLVLKLSVAHKQRKQWE